jgi:hypothetical protein
MAQAAARAVDAQILKDRPVLRFSGGGYEYVIRREPGRVIYSVSGSGSTFSAPVVWALGFGSIGQTYLYSHQGQLYESRVSFYTPIGGLDLTIGHRRSTPANAEEAAGRLLQTEEKNRCLGCHTAESSNEVKGGVQCERCHPNTQQHAQVGTAPLKLSLLSKDALSDFCGGCHRTSQEIVAFRTFNINNVRSQPYRLSTSKCYRSSPDKQISCVGCHDPHQDLVKETSYYDAKCQACHGASGKKCPQAKQECVRCHMPKVDFPDGHSRFTDHRIRVARPGEAFPI